MKPSRFAAALTLLALTPAAAVAAADQPPLDLPYWTVAPFALLLLSIALLPLAFEHWWHSNLNRLMVAAGFSLFVVGYLVGSDDGSGRALHELRHAVEEYVSFIILLGSLYVIAGGIVIRGDIQGRPATNTGILAFGAIIANLIGTTGASMLLIRPMLRINQARRRVGHIPIFFIFVVSNLGGLLTPLGDPPLFLGFLRGVDFFWTLGLWQAWLMANGAVLIVFLFWDIYAYRHEPKRHLVGDERRTQPLRVGGLINVVFLAGVVGGVLLKSQVADASPWLKYLPEAVMVLSAAGSLVMTPIQLRAENRFTWGPILEVAVLFIGIFITMVPALQILASHGEELKQNGLVQPWHYFWLTGLLSSFLDNAPTYLTFATLAAGTPRISVLMDSGPQLLAAVSCGAVFMGANTYIGNGPNFMVKAIAEECGYKTPSFFGYMLYSMGILVPIFIVITLVLF